MHRAIQVQRDRLNGNARPTHHALLQSVKHPGDNVVVFVQLAALLAHRLERVI